jgi:hypothetical protein
MNRAINSAAAAHRCIRSVDNGVNILIQNAAALDFN